MWTDSALVLASGNHGKFKEFSKLFGDFAIEVISQAKLGVKSPEETGLTFIENALLKARHASAITGLPAIADDSGLVIPALDGAPGLYSARYAGANASDQENVSLLLEQMKHLSGTDRQGHYICALALIRHASDPDPLVTVGRWQGTITNAPRGDSGFGYDPIFLPNNLDQTAAEIDQKLKNQLSHRGLAVIKLRSLVR
ncbi:MAG: non-canonical purine NTP pyrophosphatase, RdgB/HAM1 family [Gammaproteobacteria bacterium]|nr:non-canonical purine NTP pyrophosphatase, RdgB/HAM1 family [Gammaproteobacteria bacterium]HAN81111.1 non-canonical purine NTP pyrophosphatase, RdgB/HAM1 family [Gammaproteobacteria bacterium]